MQWHDRIIFLYSGLFDHINGIDFYLNALTKIPEDLKKKMKAVFLGRGPLEKDVENAALINEHIEYLGKIPYEKMPEYYSAADVFVIPRPSCDASETLMPMKLYEAMAMKKIVLVSSVKPMVDAVENGALGIIYPKGNTDQFLQVMSDLIKNPNKYINLIENTRKKVVAEYTWQQAHKKLLDIYNAIIEK
jgi:glycosyltransferase involved in cell wall biosynthesis